MNPFINSFRLRVVKKTVKGPIEEAPSLVIGTHRQFVETRYVEQQRYSRLYYIPYVEDILFKRDMSSKGRDLLIYIYYNIKKDCDFIEIKSSKVCDEMCISRPTLYRAIQELVDSSIITKHRGFVWWVNPMYIFNGDRINFYNERCPSCIDVVNDIESKDWDDEG